MRRYIAFLTLILGFSQSTLAQDIPAVFQAAEGKVFSASGPNCFATALKLTGVTRSFRAMDEPEFSQITKQYCRKVERPQMGDVGVFETPGFGFIHAFVYLNETLGMQKPGVDYAGQTPVAFYSLESISYAYLASPECRRYAKHVSECANKTYYLRCAPVDMQGNAWAEHHDKMIQNIEVKFDVLLENNRYGAAEAELYIQIKGAVAEARASLVEALPHLPVNLGKFLAARMVSLEKQIEFLKVKFPGQ